MRGNNNMSEALGGDWTLEASAGVGCPGGSRGGSRADGVDRGVGPVDPRVRQSLEYCHRVTKRRARNFYYGLRLTPEPKRSALYVIYAFMRACDDLVDSVVEGEADPRVAERLGSERIEAFRAQMDRALSDDPSVVGCGEDVAGGHWPAFRHVVRQYRIDPGMFAVMLEGQRLDLVRHRYETFEQLYDYCYKVASVVGLVCIEVWGYRDPPGGREPTAKLAEYRGVAFQLTNILRDVVEDARRGRLYLPVEDLRRFGLDDPQAFVGQLARGEVGVGYDALLAHEARRAQYYYELSADLENRIDPSCRSTSWAMTRIYRGLLEKIAADPRLILRRRVRLSSLQKLRIALSAAWRR